MIPLPSGTKIWLVAGITEHDAIIFSTTDTKCPFFHNKILVRE